MWKKLASVFAGVCILLSFSIHVSAATYLWPVPGVKYISCYYGNGHAGIDIAANGNHEIVAAREGTVIAAASTSCTHINNAPNACCNWGMGNYVQIKHSDGSYATYMHMKYGSVTVSKGQYVSRGTKIGMMGSSGNSTGQHLHFQVGYSSSNTINVNPDSLGYDYSNSSDPLGNPVNLGDNFYAIIVNVAAWKHLHYEENGNVDLRAAQDNTRQIWKFERQSDLSYKIRSTYDGKLLDVDGAGTSKGANVQAYIDHNHDAQKWFFYGSSGHYYIRAKHSNLVLDLSDNNQDDGTNIQMWDYNGSNAQIFQVYRTELTAPVLNVIAGTSATDTQFTWSSALGTNVYNVRIKQGEADYSIWNVFQTKCNTKLSAGTYTAYIDACNYTLVRKSNEVTFTVEEDCSTVKIFSSLALSSAEYSITTQIANLNVPAVYSVASYDSFGRPLNIKAKNISAGTIDVVLALPWKKNSAYIKVYLWDSLENMQPLCEPVIVD